MPRLIRARGRLCALLYGHEDYRQIFLDRVAEELEDNWFEEELLADVDRVADTLRPHLHLSAHDFDSALEELRTYIKGVAPQLWEELGAPPEEWVVPISNGQPSPGGPAGTVNAEFLIPMEFFDPTQTRPLQESKFEMTWRGKPAALQAVIGIAGYRSQEPQWHEYPILMVGGVGGPSGKAIFLFVTLDPELLATTHEFELDMFDAQGWFITIGADFAPAVQGSLRGKAHCELVEIDGKRYLQGSMDVAIYSGLADL